MFTEISPIEGNVCNFNKESFCMDSSCAIEKLSLSLESCEPFCATDNDSAKTSVLPEILGTDVLVGGLNSISIAETSEQRNNEGKDNVGSDGVFETKCPDGVSSSPQRKSRMNQKTQTRRPKKAAGRCRKADKKNSSLDPILLNVARRRRSILCKRVRSSVWGLLGNISQVFKQNIGLDVNQSVHKKSRRRKGGQGNRKRTNKNQAGGSSDRSNEKILVSTTGIRLKVKLGKVVNQSCFTNAVPVIGDDHAKCWRTDIEFPKLTDIAKDKMDGPVLDVQLTDKNPESAVVMEKMSGKTVECCGHVIHCQPESEGLGVAVDNSYLDPGTSPDSEVINVIPDVQVGGEVQENLHDVLTSSEAGVIVQCGRREKMRVGFYSSEASISTTTGNVSGNTSSSEGLSREPFSLSRVTNFGVSSQTSKADNVGLESSESQISKKLVQHTKTKGQKLSKGLKSRGASKGRSEGKGNACKQKGNLSQSANKSKIKEKADSEKIACKVESHPETGDYTLDDHEHNGAKNKSTSEDMYNLEVVPSGVMEQCPLPRNAWVRCDDCYKWRRIQAALADSIEETNRRWICKDSSDKAFADCSIRQEKSNAEINVELEISDASGEEDACDARLNSNRLEQKHSTVPQQSSWKLIKSNLFLHRSRKKQTIDEVMVCHCKPSLNGRMGCGDGCLNRMLNIECVQGTCPCGGLCSNQQFQKHNYAQLRWFRCGKKGYGLQLLEDISRGQFLIEYVGEVLDMHAYEARQKEYARKCHKHFYFMTLNGSEVIDACAKGNLGRFINHSCDPNCRTEKWMVNGEVCIGLFALRDIKKGEEVTFDYNYVRVFGAAAKKCVCGSSQCRGYLGGDPSKSEVIVQGDSDEEYPEPVMVHDNGEIDNNLENLISATSSFDGNATGIAETMVRDYDQTEKPTTENQDAKMLLKDKDGIDKSSVTVGNLEIATGIKKCKSEETVSLELECPDDIMSKTISAVHQESSIAGETTKKSLCSVERLEAPSNTVETKKKSKSDKVEDSAKSHPFTKTYRSSSSVKKGKLQKNSVNVTKSQVVAHKPHLLPHKPKKPLEGSYNGRFEAVEEKLNELLDDDGGISRRKKDAPKGYLKLLLLTAASGDSGNGEAIQSNRDLSMILDALLKTKSRVVLLDIINKNGLQMLHNIMKRYRWDFNKIPILRKLLKVLEYLAMREILTMEHIMGGPPCPGVESFKESIFTLTEHDDKQVHQSARNFRDMWIPRHLRKNFCTDRDDCRIEFHRGSKSHSFSVSQTNLRDHSTRPMEATDGIKQVTAEKVPVDAAISEGCSASCSSGCTTNGVKTRKRKSRWDQPKEERIQPILPQISNSSSQPEIGEVVLDQSSPGDLNSLSQQIDPNTGDNGSQGIDEDLPPGFSSPCDFPPGFSPPCDVPPGFSAPCEVPPGFSNPCNPPLVSSSSLFEMVLGYPQERFNSRLSVSFGIPLPVVNQLGTQAETTESWVVAPGIPFLPFPPLPPYPRAMKDPVTINQPAEKVVKESNFPPTYQSAQETPSTSGSIPPPLDIQTPGPNIRKSFRGVSGSSSSLGMRYFRQQKWNNSRVGPPWHRNRNGWGPAGPDPRSGICSMGVGNAEDRSNGVQSVCNKFYHQPHHQS